MSNMSELNRVSILTMEFVSKVIINDLQHMNKTMLSIAKSTNEQKTIEICYATSDFINEIMKDINKKIEYHKGENKNE